MSAKFKTRSSAVKRFKKAGSKVKRGSAYRSHINTKRSGDVTRGMSITRYVSKAEQKNVERLIGG
ncbi:MAG: 50S ribosomal protein L35 [Candidatus Comchoanobacterales bacterium]